MNRIYLIITLLVFASACQTVNVAGDKFSCSQLDWFEVGRSDGVQGRNSLGWEERQVKCSGFSDIHHESYTNGWYAGINEFCSFSHGFAYGKSGNEYKNVCPKGKEEAFLQAYNKGRQIYKYEKDIQVISEKLQTLSELAQKADADKSREVLKRMNELETQMEFNRALIAKINREVNESPSPSTSL